MEEKVEVYGVDIGGAHPYDFLNKHNLNVEVGRKVFVKVGTGGAKLGKVVYVKKRDLESIKDYKSIVEVVGLTIPPETLSDEENLENFQVALGRIYRSQWNSDLNSYCDDWSDLIVRCAMPNGEIKTGDIFLTEDSKIKIVGFSTIKKSSKAKLQELKDKVTVEEKKSIFSKIFGK